MDFNNVPIGLTLRLSEPGENRIDRFRHLTETEKEHIIFACRDARTKEERERILDRMDGSII